MKLKILLAPALLVLIVVMAIWVLNPAYKDLKAKKEVLKAETAKLEDVKAKNAKAAAAYDAWNSNPEKRDVILTYVPAERREEEMIDTINSLVSSSGLALYNLSVDSVSKASSAPAVSVVAEGGEEVLLDTNPVPGSFSVSLGVAGDYAKIKALLDKINTLQRFNGISMLTISKANFQEGAENQAADDGTSTNLQANLALDFNWLEKYNLEIVLNNKLFTAENFDMSVADDIKKKMTTNLNTLNVGLSGRVNPFVK